MSKPEVLKADDASSSSSDSEAGSTTSRSLKRIFGLQRHRSDSPKPRHRRRLSDTILAKLTGRSRSPSPERRASEPPSAETSDSDEPASDNNVVPNSAFADEDSDSEEDLGPPDPMLLSNTQSNRGNVSVSDHLQAQDSIFSPVDDLPNLIRRAFMGHAPTTPTSSTRKGKKPIEALPLRIGSPVYERNRCTITLEHGDPNKAAAEAKRTRSYLVASDMSQESLFAIEWVIGTVLRQGDTCLCVSAIESEAKLDHEPPTTPAGHYELRTNQRERLDRAQALQRQIVSLLERTRLHVTVLIQALHASNSRHMLIDIIDFSSPSLVVIGSRGLSKLKSTLLGSVSSYVVQKSSVPVMVARQRLRTPLAHRPKSELDRQPRTSLANAEIEVPSSAGIVSEESGPDNEEGGSTTTPPNASVDELRPDRQAMIDDDDDDASKPPSPIGGLSPEVPSTATTEATADAANEAVAAHEQRSRLVVN